MHQDLYSVSEVLTMFTERIEHLPKSLTDSLLHPIHIFNDNYFAVSEVEALFDKYDSDPSTYSANPKWKEEHRDKVFAILNKDYRKEHEL